MKYKLKYKIFSLITILLIVFGLSINSSALNYDKDMLVKIGLCYGSDSKPNYNAFHDNGFSFGYYDSNSTFVPLYTSSSRFISVANDFNYDFSSETNTLTQGGSDIGAYHYELSSTYSTQSAAQSKINSLGLSSTAFITYTGGAYKIRVGNYSTLSTASTAAKNFSSSTITAAAVGNEANTFTVVDMNTGKIVFEFCPTSINTFAVKPKAISSEKTKIKNGGTNYYGDFEFFKNSLGKLNLINVLTIDDYVKGVLPYEMSNTWPLEALKAQAVAARNYAYANMNKHKNDGFMLCDNTHCQMYCGTTYANDNTDRSVDETRGMILTYNGRLVEGYYHASSGGYTENVENIWFSAIPYLVAVESSYEDLENANYGVWHYEITKAQLLEKLKNGGYDISSISNFYVSKYTDVGNVYEVTIVDKNGKTYTISKETARVKLYPYVKSQRFNISRAVSLYAISSTTTKNVTDCVSNSYVIDGNNQLKKINTSASSIKIKSAYGTNTAPVSNPDIFVIDGKGYGNNVGMSQEGAKGMAEAGIKFDKILTHYYTGTKIEILK